jgi:hypothetical protein
VVLVRGEAEGRDMTKGEQPTRGARSRPDIYEIIDALRDLIDAAISEPDDSVVDELHERWEQDEECRIADALRRDAYRKVERYCREPRDGSDDASSEPDELKDYSDANTRYVSAMEDVYYDVGFRRGVLFLAQLILSRRVLPGAPLKPRSTPVRAVRAPSPTRVWPRRRRA